MAHRSSGTAIFIFLLIFTAVGFCVNDWQQQAESQLQDQRILEAAQRAEAEKQVIVEASPKIESQIASSKDSEDSSVNSADASANPVDSSVIPANVPETQPKPVSR